MTERNNVNELMWYFICKITTLNASLPYNQLGNYTTIGRVTEGVELDTGQVA